MDFRSWKDCVVLVAAVAVTRLVFRSRYLYDLDSVNFALALDAFDPALSQPHPPGYYLYVLAGRLFRVIFGDPNTAFVVLSVAASCGMAVAIYALAKNWYGVKAARYAGFLFVISPLCWFHGIVALTYIVEGFFSALLGYLCWETYTGRRKSLAPSAIVLGLAVGFRQSSILFLGPLWLLSGLKAGRRQALTGAAACGLTTLCWFVPMVLESGGVTQYFTALYSIWSTVPAQRTVFSYPFWQGVGLALTRAALMLSILVLCFGPFLSMPLLVGPARQPTWGLPRFVGVWLLPGFVFFCLIYLLFVNSGYLLILCPPIFAWLGSKTADWLDGPRAAGWERVGTVVASTMINLIAFVWGPWYCSYQGVRNLESDLESLQQVVRQGFSPSSTVLVGFDSHFMGFRHAGYYLPEFLTLVYPEAPFPGGRRILGMERRRTVVIAHLPARQKEFLLVPMPRGQRYDEYLARVIARFPSGVVQSVPGRERLHVGPAAKLHHAFPSLTPKHGKSYTSVIDSQ